MVCTGESTRWRMIARSWIIRLSTPRISVIRYGQEKSRDGAHFRAESFEGGSRHGAEFLGKSTRLRLIRVVDRGQLSIRKFRIKAGVIFPNMPDTDHTNTKLFHCD